MRWLGPSNKPVCPGCGSGLIRVDQDELKMGEAHEARCPVCKVDFIWCLVPMGRYQSRLVEDPETMRADREKARADELQQRVDRLEDRVRQFMGVPVVTDPSLPDNTVVLRADGAEDITMVNVGGFLVECGHSLLMSLVWCRHCWKVHRDRRQPGVEGCEVGAWFSVFMGPPHGRQVIPMKEGDRCEPCGETVGGLGHVHHGYAVGLAAATRSACRDCGAVHDNRHVCPKTMKGTFDQDCTENRP